MVYLLMTLLFLTALFLILLVLVQRGKGGGLAGALGGMGGQSAFGTKAGDLFTRITIGVAAFWIVLCMITVKYLGSTSEADILNAGAASSAPGGGAVSPAPSADKTKGGSEVPAPEKAATPAGQPGASQSSPAPPAGTTPAPAEKSGGGGP